MKARALRYVVACMAMGWAAAAYAQAPLTSADNGKAVTLRVGQTIAVTLPENASTGYVWAIDTIDAALVADRGKESSYAAGAVGAAGQVTWTFGALAPGNTALALKRWRPWEGDKSVVQRFRVQLTIVR